MTNVFSNLNDKTAILESLGWDEEALSQLIDFISLQDECFIPTHPSKLLSEIEDHFGKPTRSVMEKIMIREIKLIKKESTDEN